jgi:hypothetical protein
MYFVYFINKKNLSFYLTNLLNIKIINKFHNLLYE